MRWWIWLGALTLAPIAFGDEHAAELTSRAVSWVDSLDDAQRAKAVMPFDAPERMNWTYLPQVRAVSEGPDFLDAYAHVTGSQAVRGNLVPDAHLATILFQHGVRTLYSLDRDFLKFPSLDVRDPFG